MTLETRPENDLGEDHEKVLKSYKKAKWGNFLCEYF